MAENLFSFLSLDTFFLLVTSDDLGVDDVDEPVLEDDGESPWDLEDLPPKNLEIRLANDNFLVSVDVGSTISTGVSGRVCVSKSILDMARRLSAALLLPLSSTFWPAMNLECGKDRFCGYCCCCCCCCCFCCVFPRGSSSLSSGSDGVYCIESFERFTGGLQED